MPPLVLMLVDSLLTLAVHHDRRARLRAVPGFAATRVHAEIRGPEAGEPAAGGVRMRLVLRSSGAQQHAEADAGEAEAAEQIEICELHIDLERERILARDVDLAELELDRSGIARLIGELEAWCYARLPMEKQDEELNG